MARFLVISSTPMAKTGVLHDGKLIILNYRYSYFGKIIFEVFSFN